MARIGFGATLLAALDTLAQGRPADAAALLRGPAAQGEHQPFTTDRTPSYWLRTVLSDALERGGTPAERIAAARSAIAGSGIPPVHVPLRGFVWLAGSRRLSDLLTQFPADSGRSP
jgi:hypothetical protein